METVFERVRRLIGEVISVKEESIVPHAALIEDLGADSLDLVNLVVAVEQEFSKNGKIVKVLEEEADEIRTVQDILDFLRRKGFSD
jgi:acyl carrier protein